jgi:hypothetical protein
MNKAIKYTFRISRLVALWNLVIKGRAMSVYINAPENYRQDGILPNKVEVVND